MPGLRLYALDCPWTTSASIAASDPRLYVQDNGKVVISNNGLVLWQSIGNSAPGVVDSDWFMFIGDRMCDANYCVEFYINGGKSYLDFKKYVFITSFFVLVNNGCEKEKLLYLFSGSSRISRREFNQEFLALEIHRNIGRIVFHFANGANSDSMPSSLSLSLNYSPCFQVQSGLTITFLVGLSATSE